MTSKAQLSNLKGCGFSEILLFYSQSQFSNRSTAKSYHYFNKSSHRSSWKLENGCTVSNPWYPGAFARLPWAAFVALLGAIVGIGGSTAVLILSDGVPITEWTFQPTVYLSIVSTITTIMIHYALAQGVTTAWWTRALKTNTKISDLHQYWKENEKQSARGTYIWAKLQSRCISFYDCGSISNNWTIATTSFTGGNNSITDERSTASCACSTAPARL